MLKVIRSPAKVSWHLVFGAVVLGVYATKAEAYKVLSELSCKFSSFV